MISAIRVVLFCLGPACLIPAFFAFQAQSYELSINGLATLACMTAFGLLIGMSVMLRPGLSPTEQIWQYEASSSDPVLLVDSDGSIQRRNGAAENLDAFDAPSETLPQFLKSHVVDARSRFFRLEEQLQSEKRIETVWATQKGEISVCGHRLPDLSTLWRFQFRKTASDHPNQTLSSPYTVSVGGSGSILAMSPDLEAIFDTKPKRLTDILSLEPNQSSGFCHLLTPSGRRQCFYMAGPERAGRQDYELFLRDEIFEVSDAGQSELPLPMIRIAEDGESRASITQWPPCTPTPN